MPKRSDLAGKKFGKLTVLEPAFTKYGKLHWKCLCDCGNFSYVNTQYLKNRNTQSCGCLKSEVAKRIFSKLNTTHGETKTRLFNLWTRIKDRCYREKNPNYRNYGGRGIKMCDEWKDDFVKFRTWAINSGYKEELLKNGKNKWTIDRINNDGDYEPSNCRWVTIKQQCRNRRTNSFVEYNGEKYCYAELSENFNINKQIIQYRISHGWSINDTINTPVRKYNKGEI